MAASDFDCDAFALFFALLLSGSVGTPAAPTTTEALLMEIRDSLQTSAKK